MKLWQGGVGWEPRLKGLQGRSHLVLWHLTLVATWGNRVPEPGETAKALGMRHPNVIRAYKELMEAELLMKVEGIYRLNPLFCWRGNEAQYEAALRELQPRKMLREALFGGYLAPVFVDKGGRG